AIISKCVVFCICRQKVLLDKDYDDLQLNEYSRSSRCKLNNKK
ncbi:10640_t:CDS:1, partial [Funneliformis caledonium]